MGHQITAVVAHCCRAVVMVNGEIIHVCASDAKNGAVPVQIVVAHRNQADGGVYGAHRSSIAVEVVRVCPRIAVAAHPSSPNLVADFPILHPEWFGMAIGGPHGTVLGIGRPVGVFDPRCGLRGCSSTTFHVHSDRWFRAKVAAELYEFVSPEIARFRLIGPGEIHPNWALVTRPYAPHPMIVLCYVAARPANEGGPQCLDFLKHIGADSIHGVPWQQRNLV